MAKSGIKNLKAFQKKLQKRMVDAPEKTVDDLIRRSTSLVEQTTLDSIRSGGTGITYQKYNPEDNIPHRQKEKHLQLIQVC